MHDFKHAFGQNGEICRAVVMTFIGSGRICGSPRGGLRVIVTPWSATAVMAWTLTAASSVYGRKKVKTHYFLITFDDN